MVFKALEGVSESTKGIELVSEIINLLDLEYEVLNKSINRISNKLCLSDHYIDILGYFLSKINSRSYPISLYTPTRLLIAIDRYKNNNNREQLFIELLARFFYDSCSEGKNLVLEYPPLLQIEIASRCNYRCVFCYQTDPSFSNYDSKYMGFMTLDLFKEIINEIEGNIPYITFASRGEPTLNPDFLNMLSYCKNKFLDIKLNTNASTLNKAKINAILDVCDTVVFSIDTPDVNQYPDIRVGGDLNRVLKNIALFNELRAIHPRGDKVRTRASGVMFNPDIQSEEKYTKIFSPLFDQTAFVKYNPWEKIYKLQKNEIDTPCHSIFYRFFVWFDGSYNPCDMDYKSTLMSGHNPLKISSSHTVKQAWSSKRMNEIRDLHQAGKRQTLDPCKQCPHI